MKSILVPVDGSRYADRALDIACDLALSHGAEITLLHVLLRERGPDELLSLSAATRLAPEVAAALTHQRNAPAPQLTADEIMGAPNSAAKHVTEDHLRAVADAVQQEAAERVEARGLACTFALPGEREPASDIVAAARDAKVDAIVMGTRGLGEIEAITLGSTSHEVCRRAPCTCIMVH